MIRLLMLIDSLLSGREYARYLDVVEDIRVVGEATTPEQTLDLARAEHPDVVLVDSRFTWQTSSNDRAA